MIGPAFRFAPSPNGRLHLGHAYSALLNAQEARASGGRFLLRIEDIDTIRCTPALAKAALADLEWLGIVSDEPVLFQSDHLADYHAAQDRLRDLGLLYPCFCSRQDIVAAADPSKRDPEGLPLYPGTCKRLSPDVRQRRIAGGLAHALRMDIGAASALIGRSTAFYERSTKREVALEPAVWGDVVLARKDIGTSYHVAVVVDDARQAITHVVRGRDLYAATAIHRMLQELLGFPEPVYHHHRLIGDEMGRKLSKSVGDRSLASLRQAGVTPKEIRRALGF
jgi:glutamyl-Q tRNA(Asp) synthetase